MTDRATQIAAFLASVGWGGATRIVLAGDASARRYERLRHGVEGAVLMDAPPSAGESTERFARVGRWLGAMGYSVPQILAEDHSHGLLLLEDLGDSLFARVLSETSQEEGALYALATDFLVDLHDRPAPAFAPPLLSDGLAELTTLTLDWLPRAMGQTAQAKAARIPDLVAATFGVLTSGQIVLSLRDFHSENLFWLPDRPGIAALGLLDFQDAVATHPAYDLVSLLQDARRDVSPETEAEMIGRYVAAKGIDAEAFGAIYALLGAQRALRIIGIFMRLAVRDGRTSYLRFVPRVWSALQRDLRHPALGALQEAINTHLPAPDVTLIAANVGHQHA